METVQQEMGAEAEHDFQTIPSSVSSSLHSGAFDSITSPLPIHISTSSGSEGKRKGSKRGGVASRGQQWFLFVFLVFFSTVLGNWGKKIFHTSPQTPSPCSGLCFPFLTLLSLNRFFPFLHGYSSWQNTH